MTASGNFCKFLNTSLHLVLLIGVAPLLGPGVPLCRAGVAAGREAGVEGLDLFTGVALGLGAGVAAGRGGGGVAMDFPTGVAIGLPTGVAIGRPTGVAIGLPTGVAIGLPTGVGRLFVVGVLGLSLSLSFPFALPSCTAFNLIFGVPLTDGLRLLLRFLLGSSSSVASFFLFPGGKSELELELALGPPRSFSIASTSSNRSSVPSSGIDGAGFGLRGFGFGAGVGVAGIAGDEGPAIGVPTLPIFNFNLGAPASGVLITSFGTFGGRPLGLGAGGGGAGLTCSDSSIGMGTGGGGIARSLCARAWTAG